ncbi:MAG: PIN domain-containing protein [Thaumarchaeota archaeon]|nr:PIN domain-containing protein [Candidatus Calditenuaceae archaeon]
MRKGRFVVLDATPLIVSPSVPTGDATAVTTPSVVSELLRTTSEIQEARIRASLETGSLNVMTPSRSHVTRVRQAMSRRERSGASVADVEVLAMALQLAEEGNEVLLLSDDSVVQKVATKLGIRCKGVKYPERQET